MRIFVYICIFLLVGCETKSVYNHYSEDAARIKAAQSEKIIQNRQAILQNVSLLEKAEYFEKFILKKMHPTHRFSPKLYSKGIPGKLRMDMTGLFLSALVFKYLATEEEKTKKEILKILESIYHADESNGLDGFIPYKVKIENDKLITSSNETHINVYTQLLFAYIPIITYLEDKEIKDKTLRHLKLILNHLQKENFTLVDHLGKEVEYSDLSPKFFSIQRNRKQMLLVFLDLALKHNILPEKQETLSELRNDLSENGYEEDILNLQVKFLNLEFPTHSSSWLNLKNSFIGYHIDHQDYYRKAFTNLFDKYRDEENLLFILMEESMKKTPDVSKEYIESKLAEFPQNPTNHEIINSFNPNIDTLENAPYTKLKRELEVKKALPYYQRPMRSFEWKLNQMRVDGNFKSTGNYQYTGIDYLTAYWMYRWLFRKQL
ncbi:MAG: hypothetical protein NE327_17840 [Lentisphaeraceae bacterium]|nr:hypothetical protein [Lentisphaeraceae bacterium]